MNSHHDYFLKQGRTNWLRLSTTFVSTIQGLEEELERMKQKNVPAEFIAKRENQIECLVSFYNETEDLLQAYHIGMVNKNAEIMITLDCLGDAFRNNHLPIINSLKKHG